MRPTPYLRHALAALQQQRMDRVEMARRLARWLMLPPDGR
jgi:hypothetical protein